MTVRELYDAVASKYDTVVATSKYVGPAWLERTLPELLEPARAIDFACANGVLGRVLRTNYPRAHLTGLDISELMVAEARGSGAYDDLFVHDLNLPVPQIRDASVQLAVALGFAEFLNDPALFIAEAARVLAPGGTLLISFQEFWPEREVLAPRYTRSGVVPHNAYSAPEVAAMLKLQPFSLESLESTTGYVSGTGFACPYLMARATRQAGSTCASEA
jgi:predicted TPR repeat methyltransferase